MGHDVRVETGCMGNVFELEQLLACRRVDLDVNLAIAFHVGTAIAGEDVIGPIELLERGLIKMARVVRNDSGQTYSTDISGHRQIRLQPARERNDVAPIK